MKVVFDDLLSRNGKPTVFTMDVIRQLDDKDNVPGKRGYHEAIT